MVQFNCPGNLAHHGSSRVPTPGVAKPDGWQHAQTRGFRPAIRNTDLYEDVFYIAFRVFDEYVEIAIFVEHACIEQFEFWLVLTAVAILFQ